jgi:hypothetical protein
MIAFEEKGIGNTMPLLALPYVVAKRQNMGFHHISRVFESNSIRQVPGVYVCTHIAC